MEPICRSDRDSDRHWGFVGVVILAGLLFFVRLHTRALWSEEVRWAEIARNMFTSGDYFWPTINGHTYYDKPLGSYWLVLLPAWILGGVDEFVARVPSAASGVLAVTFLVLLARKLYDDRTALLAGIILATSFGFVVFSRTASADIETVFGLVLALWLCVSNENRRSGWWIVGLWIVMALTSLTKGLLGFVLPVLVYGTYRCTADTTESSQRGGILGFVDRQRWLFNAITPFAMVGALVVYGLPFWMSMRENGLSEGLGMVWRENVQRFFNAHNHRGPIYLYTYVVFELTLPWALLLPAALIQAHSRRERGDRFALAYFWSIFAFFTLSSSRRSYYLLPILPAVALLIARLLNSTPERLTRWSDRLTRVGLGVLSLAMLLGESVLVLPRSILPFPASQFPSVPAPALTCVLSLFALGCVGYAIVRFHMASVLVTFLAIACTTMAYLFLVELPELERYRTQQPFLLQVRTRLGDNLSKLVLYRSREAIFYLAPGNPLAEAGRPQELRDLLAVEREVWVLARERDLPDLPGVKTVVSHEDIQPWEGPEIQHSKLVLLRVKP